MSQFIIPDSLSRSLSLVDLGAHPLKIIAEEAPPPTLEHREPTAAPSLVNVHAQMLTYGGVILFSLTIAAAIGLVNRKRAMLFVVALLSALAIAPFFLPRRALQRETSPPPASLLDKRSHQT